MKQHSTFKHSLQQYLSKKHTQDLLHINHHLDAIYHNISQDLDINAVRFSIQVSSFTRLHGFCWNDNVTQTAGKG